MRRRPHIPPYERVFVGTEGDAAFVLWLKALGEAGDGAVDAKKRTLSLVVRPCGGGSPLDIVSYAARQRNRELRNGRFLRSVLVIDGDREMATPDQATRIRQSARDLDFDLVVLKPRYEAMLVRLHEGYERRSIAIGEDERLLRQLWNGIWDGNRRRPLTIDELDTRFTLADLHRAAAHDPDLRALLEFVRLWPPP